MRKLLLCLTMASIAIAIGAVAVPAQAASKKVFNSLPDLLPGNVAGVGLESIDQLDSLPGDRDGPVCPGDGDREPEENLRGPIQALR